MNAQPSPAHLPSPAQRQPPRALRRVAAAISTLLISTTLILSTTPAPPARAAPPTWRWPLDGTPRILRPFTPPPEPWLAGHRGIDLAAPADTPVLAAGPGTIRFAGPVAGKGVITIDHEGGLRTTYLPVTASVRRGQPITPGAKLGVLEPSKHHCEESCLHWGLRRGTSYLNPLQLLGHAPTRLLPFWPPPQRTPTTPQPRTAASIPRLATTPVIPPGSTPLTPLTTAIAATMAVSDPDNGSPTPSRTPYSHHPTGNPDSSPNPDPNSPSSPRITPHFTSSSAANPSSSNHPPSTLSSSAVASHWPGTFQTLRQSASSHLALILTLIGLGALMTTLLLITTRHRNDRKRHARTHPPTRVKGQHRKQRRRRRRTQKHRSPASPRLP
ncbi:M23 family metallopeptidase [Nonomuraea rubra]|uniref:M23 family metallopeptidase n=1 Tax=Nonomuraea rubra TaxID=46180 RepID=UPI0033FCD938